MLEAPSEAIDREIDALVYRLYGLSEQEIDEAGVQDGAEQVVSRSIDGWNCGTPTSAITVIVG